MPDSCQDKISKFLRRPSIPGKSASAKISTGYPALDACYPSGLGRGSVLCFSGGTGTGKTACALYSFAKRLNDRKVKGAVISFEESEEEIYSFLKTCGLNSRKKARVVYLPPVKPDIEHLTDLLLELIKSGVSELVINSLGAFIELDSKVFALFIKSLAALSRKFGVMVFLVYPTKRDYYLPESGLPDDVVYAVSTEAYFLAAIQNFSESSRKLFIIKSSVKQGVFASFSLEFRGLLPFLTEASEDEKASHKGQSALKALFALEDLRLYDIITEEYGKTFAGASLRIYEKMSHYDEIEVERERISLLSRSSPYDIIVHVADDLRQLAAEGAIVPVGIAEKVNERKEFYPAAIESCTLNRDLYSLPDNLNPFGLVYRKDLFKKHGVKPPSNWADLAEKIKYLMKAESSVTEGLSYTLSPEYLNSIIKTYLYANLSGGGKVNIDAAGANGDNFRECVKFMGECINKYRIVDINKARGRKQDDLSADFVRGKVIMLHGYMFGHLSARMKREPQYLKQIGFMSLPGSVPGRKNVNLSSAFTNLIPVTTRNHPRAAELIKMIAGEKLGSILHAEGNYPSLSSNIRVNEFLGNNFRHFENAPAIGSETIFDYKYNRDHALEKINAECVTGILINKSDVSLSIEAAKKNITEWKKAQYYSKIVDSSKVMMAGRYSARLTLGDIAAAAGLSRNFFGKIFKQRTGEPVFSYLNGVRLNEAARLLRESHRFNISEISRKVGFSDPKYFGRAFKKAYKTTPVEYRLRNDIR